MASYSFNQYLTPSVVYWLLKVFQGFLHSKAASLVGIEKNTYFCEMQQRTIAKYNMAGRVKIVCSDVLEQGQLLASADVVVLNYVFEMFRTLEERAR